MSQPPITIVLADDHTIVRQGLRLLIQQNDALSIVGEASDGAEAVSIVTARKPRVLVCDISMPRLTGIEVARRVLEADPAVRVLFLTMQDSEDYILEAMQVGAAGFLSKSAVSDELTDAILTVAQGREYFSNSVYSKAFQALRHMAKRTEIRITPREREVIGLLAEGLSTKLIADKLSVSEYTVSNHRANLLRKFEAQNVAELIRKAAELKII